MTPTQIIFGVCLVSAFLGGAQLGRMAVKSDWDEQKAEEALSTLRAHERNLEARAAADQALANVQSAVSAALRKPHVSSAPIPCPASGDVRSAVIPGLAEQLRALDEISTSGAASGVERLHSSGTSSPSR